MEMNMRKALLAGASAFALALSFGPALADGPGGGPNNNHDDPSLSVDVSLEDFAVAVDGSMAANNGGKIEDVAYADHGAIAANNGGSVVSGSNQTDIHVISKNDLDAHFGGTSITFGAAAAEGGNGGDAGGSGSSNNHDGPHGFNNNNNNNDNNNDGGACCGTGGDGGDAAAAAGSMTNGYIVQNGNAFQNFAGINTMTQSTAPYNNNQAATSVAAYAPVAFGGAASQ